MDTHTHTTNDQDTDMKFVFVLRESLDLWAVIEIKQSSPKANTKHESKDAPSSHHS